MSPHRLVVAACSCLLFAPAVLAQSAPVQIAHAMIAAASEAVDDPDAVAVALLRTAAANSESPAAASLVSIVAGRIDRLQHPGALLPVVAAIEVSQAHGLLVQGLKELRLELLRASGIDGVGRELPAPPADLEDPWRGWPDSFLVIGPFGDSGDAYVDVPYPPELRFPAVDDQLDGRFGPVRVRTVTRRPFERRFDLRDPARDQEGCFYALCRVDVAAETSGFVEVDGDGALQVFANGAEIGRVVPWLNPERGAARFPVQLPAGQNQLLLKTCSSARSRVALRCIDGRGRALGGLKYLAAEAPLQPAPAPVAAAGGVFQDGIATLRMAAAAATGEDRAQLQVAELLQAERLNDAEVAVGEAVALMASPPQDPAAVLALAQALRTLGILPEELRLQKARELEDRALAALPKTHHRAMVARVRQLGVEDKREDALRLLRQAMLQGTAGPETYALALDTVEKLEFEAEVEPLLRQWITALPRDTQPRSELATALKKDGAPAAALLELCAALRARPDATNLAEAAESVALDLGDVVTARRCRELAEPVSSGVRPLQRLVADAAFARRSGAIDQQRQLMDAIAAHAEADADLLERTGARLLQLGETDKAIAAWQHCLLLDPSRHELRNSLARLTKAPLCGDDLLEYRRDGDAAIAAFHKTAREDGASTTVLIDQMLVEMLPDGSRVEEVHQLRRINDLQGVEAMKEPSEPANADELLLLRTKVGGRSYVPSKTDDKFSMVRLEPGAFVEWRYRNYRPAPDAEPWRSPRFNFGSDSEPYLLTEYVLILPKDARGEMRLRDFTSPTESRALADGRRVLVFRRTDVPRLPEERNAPPLGDLVPVAQFGEDASSAAYARQVRASLQRQTMPTPVVQDLADVLVKGAAGRQAALSAIHDWVQREIADGPDNGPTAAILRKKGQRLLLEASLLRAAGFQVDFVVAQSMRDSLTPDPHPLFGDDSRWPLPGMRVLGPSGPVWQFADAPRHLPLGMIAGNRAGALALVATDTSAEIVRLPTTDRDVEQGFGAEGEATLDSNGLVTFHGNLLFVDQGAYGLAEQLRNLDANVQKQAARQLSQRFLREWRLVSAAITGLEPAGQRPKLEVTCSRSLLQRDGDRSLLPIPLPSTRFLTGFGDRAGRELPLRISDEVQLDWNLLLDPGESFAIAELPPPVMIQHGPMLFVLTCTLEGRKVRIQEHAVMRAGRIELSAFGEWMQALQAVAKAETANLVLVPTGR